MHVNELQASDLRCQLSQHRLKGRGQAKSNSFLGAGSRHKCTRVPSEQAVQRDSAGDVWQT